MLTLVNPLSQVATEICPESSSDTGQPDPGHFRYLPGGGSQSQYAVPNPCNSCDDPQNADAAACSVFRLMRSKECAGARCRDSQGTFQFYRSFRDQFALQHDIRYEDPIKYPRAEGENCRFLVWALNPSIGVEDVRSRADFPYWSQAWRASQRFVEPAFPQMQVGFIVQSSISRGQHQLHIHIGRLFPDYRQAIDTLRQDPKITQSLTIRGRRFYARYVMDAPGEEAFTGANPFDVASRIVPRGEAAMPEHGILAARSRNRKGVFVLAARGLERDQLDYRAGSACRMILI